MKQKSSTFTVGTRSNASHYQNRSGTRWNASLPGSVSPFFSALPAILLLAALAVAGCRERRAADERPFGIQHRLPWTTSRLTGSLDPPLPYTAEKTFTKIKWEQP